jgi:hypothetical protein
MLNLLGQLAMTLFEHRHLVGSSHEVEPSSYQNTARRGLIEGSVCGRTVW